MIGLQIFMQMNVIKKKKMELKCLGTVLSAKHCNVCYILDILYIFAYCMHFVCFVYLIFNKCVKIR